MSKKSHRFCPVLDRPISPADCGEGRNTRYACPVACPSNPFALENYDAQLELEGNFDAAMARRGLSDPEMGAAIARVLEEHRGDLALTGALDWAFYRARGADGLTVADRWKRDGCRELRNDGRALLEAHRRIRVELIEVLEVRDERQVLCVDLLDPERARSVYVDRALASRACRFEAYLGIAYPLPDYKRLHGALLPMAEISPRGPREVLEIFAKHLGGSLEQEWLFHNMQPLFEAMVATSGERRRLTLSATDAVSAAAHYETTGSVNALGARLEKRGWLVDDLNDDDLAKGFERAYLMPLDRGRDLIAANVAGQPYCGAALLKPGVARLGATSRESLEALKKGFEKAAGKSAKFSRERIDDLAKRGAGEEPSAPPANVPPELLEGVAGLKMVGSRVQLENADSKETATQGFLDSYYRQLLDEKIDSLDGLSPREAVGDWVARPKAIEWAKGLARSCDRQALDSGLSVDVGWVLRELGLEELDFAAPPPGRKPKAGSRAAEIDGGADAPDGADDPPDEMLDEVERIGLLVEARMDAFATAEAALKAMERSGCAVVDDMYAASEGLLDDEHFDLCIVPMLLAWMALVPEGARVRWRPDLCRDCLAETWASVEESAAGARPRLGVGSPLRASREPALAIYLWNRLEQIRAGLPKKERPSTEKFGAMMLVTLAAANAISLAAAEAR